MPDKKRKRKPENAGIGETEAFIEPQGGQAPKAPRKKAQPGGSDDFMLIARAVLSATFLIALAVFKQIDERFRLAFYILAFLISSYDVLLATLKKMLKLRFLEDEFLMTLVGIAAFIIGEYTEAVILFIIYQIGQFLIRKAVRRSQNALSHLQKLRPETVNMLIAGKLTPVRPEEVMRGM